YYHKDLNRKSIVLINRLEGSCPCGGPRQDVNHVVFYCLLYRVKTQPLIAYLKAKFPFFLMIKDPSKL
ncbi:hypothetical protein X777_13078, partial [Ooceraea biroi]